MYLFYLVSAIALSAGIGVFAQYDTLAKTRDDTAASRVSISSDQQKIIGRSLRRQFQIDPTQFPAVPPGGFSRLDPQLITLSIAGGYLNLQVSSFYISASGDVLAVLDDGPASPSSGNGDIELGVSGLPQNVVPLLHYLHGDDFARGPLPAKQADHRDHENEDDQVTELEASSDNSTIVPDVVDTVVEDTAARILPVAHLNLEQLNYNETIANALDGEDVKTVAQLDSERYLQIQSRLLSE